jgi:hypothetical protein
MLDGESEKEEKNKISSPAPAESAPSVRQLRSRFPLRVDCHCEPKDQTHPQAHLDALLAECGAAPFSPGAPRAPRGRALQPARRALLGAHLSDGATLAVLECVVRVPEAGAADPSLEEALGLLWAARPAASPRKKFHHH